MGPGVHVHIRSLVRSCDYRTGPRGHVTMNLDRGTHVTVNVIMKVCLECGTETTGNIPLLDTCTCTSKWLGRSKHVS